MTNLDRMTASELREKLLEHGYDIPSSISKDFMVKKLKKAMEEKKKTSTTLGPQSTGNATGGRKTPPRAVVRPTAPEISAPTTTPPRTTRMSSSRNNARQSVGGVVSNSDLPNEPLRRSTPARRGGLKATRHSISNIPPVRVRTPPRSIVSSSRREVYQEDDNEEDDEEPMSQDSSAVGFWSQQQQQPTQQIPTRSSLRPSPLKRVRPSDSPNHQTHSLFGNATTEALMSSMDSSGFVKRQSSTISYSSPSTTSKGRFGLIVNGRKIQTDCIPNDELNPNKFIFNIPDADSVKIIVVFLPESEQFTPGTAGQICFGWPDERNEIKWHMLGHISNIRPSAIFDISDFKQAIVPAAGNSRFSFGGFSFGNNNTRGPTNAQIGISIESLQVVASSMHPQVQL
ncbi:uncharacterized protein LOC110853153 [Folsomia candida]|uniref:Protein OPI10 n=1 Tax=Folsomia candida TaxID=158441 RepID=A0A226DZQ2_FOLCA|nr:uncharacterized protein LOC110853153 [Folsomia candida]OXA50952.1 Protein OPI10 [Folsomia candida]